MIGNAWLKRHAIMKQSFIIYSGQSDSRPQATEIVKLLQVNGDITYHQ
jgi:hypothetical protein